MREPDGSPQAAALDNDPQETLLKSVTFMIASLAASLMLSMLPADAEARRLGGGRAAGMQRQVAPPKTATPPNATQNTPAAAPGATAGTGTAAANAGRRSWMGPIAGLAAGLGIAALMSHLGLGAGFANFLTLLLLAVVAVVVVRWLMRRFASQQPAGHARLATAGAGGFGQPPQPLQDAQPARFQPLPPAGTSAFAPTGSGPVMPEGFDAAEFERVAKTIFVRMQAANDAGHVEDLRRFTTPELFASLRVDLQDRGDATQQTDVVKLDAQVLETVQEDGQWIVSVRFGGLIREEATGGAQPFDETWHLVKPVDGSREWAIAGITPTQ